MATTTTRTPAPITRAPDGTGPVVQGMLITRYKGEETSQLRVFRIPKSQEQDFHSFLCDDPKYADLLENLHRPGFVKLDKQKACLKQSANDYAQSRKERGLSPSLVRWEAVPMKENSVVLWFGVHEVTNCRKSGHARVVRYLRLQDIPSPDPLPANVAEEPDGPGFSRQGKAHFAAAEKHLKSQYGEELRYGYNCNTIPTAHRGFFTQAAPHPFTPRAEAGKTEVERHLEEFGWAVLPNVLEQVPLPPYGVCRAHGCLAVPGRAGGSK